MARSPPVGHWRVSEAANSPTAPAQRSTACATGDSLWRPQLHELTTQNLVRHSPRRRLALSVRRVCSAAPAPRAVRARRPSGAAAARPAAQPKAERTTAPPAFFGGAAGLGLQLRPAPSAGADRGRPLGLGRMCGRQVRRAAGTTVWWVRNSFELCRVVGDGVAAPIATVTTPSVAYITNNGLSALDTSARHISIGRTGLMPDQFAPWRWSSAGLAPASACPRSSHHSRARSAAAARQLTQDPARPSHGARATPAIRATADDTGAVLVSGGK